MAIKEQKLKLQCTQITRIREHGVLSNLVSMADLEHKHDGITFEEFAETSAYVVGQEYEVTVKVACNG